MVGGLFLHPAHPLVPTGEGLGLGQGWASSTQNTPSGNGTRDVPHLSLFVSWSGVLGVLLK